MIRGHFYDLRMSMCNSYLKCMSIIVLIFQLDTFRYCEAPWPISTCSLLLLGKQRVELPTLAIIQKSTFCVALNNLFTNSVPPSPILIPRCKIQAQEMYQVPEIINQDYKVIFKTLNGCIYCLSKCGCQGVSSSQCWGL